MKFQKLHPQYSPKKLTYLMGKKTITGIATRAMQKKGWMGYPLLTLIRKNIPFSRIHDLKTQNTLVVQVFFPRFPLIVVNIHLTVCSKKRVKATLEKFQSSSSIIGGDINNQMRKNPNKYYDFITQDVTKKNCAGTLGRQIDYLMIRIKIQWKYRITNNLSHCNNLLDHKPLTASIIIPKEDLFKIPLINTKLLNKYLNQLKEKPNNIMNI